MQQLKHHFIPHEQNNHHAPAIHRVRHVLYFFVGVVMKLGILLLAVLLPLEVFVTPDALNAQLEDIVVETNKLRVAQGVAPLEKESLLYTSATAKASDMRDGSYFAHTNPKGVTVGDVFKNAGYEYRYAGENLSIGYSTAKDVVDAWKHSPTHYRNLVHPVFEDIGVGVAVGEVSGSPVPYFVQHFGVTKQSATKFVAGAFVENTDTYVLPQSKIFWERSGDDIRIQPEIFLNQPARDVVITHFDRDVVLSYTDGMYTTSTYLSTTEETLFQPTLPVSIRIETENGDFVESIVSWQRPAVLTPSIIDRYQMAVAYVDSMLPMIFVSRVVLLGIVAIILFSLICHIALSSHHRKFQIGFETLLSLILLLTLFFV